MGLTGWENYIGWNSVAKPGAKQYSDKESHLTIMLRFVAGLMGWENTSKNLVAKPGVNSVAKPGAKAVSSFFVQCVFEACAKQDAEIARCMLQESFKSYLTLEEPHLCFRPWTAYDCYVVGFCITIGAYTWDLDLISLEGDENVEMLSYGLTFTGSVRGSICKLNLAHGGLTHLAMIHFSKFPPEVMSQIRDLDLCNNDLDGAALSCFADSIVPQMATLIRLDLSNNPGIGPHTHTIQSIAYQAADYVSTPELQTDSLDCGMIKLFNNLATSSNLKILEMINVHIDLVDVNSLCQLIRPGSNLRKFKVGDETMTDECVAELIKIVLSPSSLKELELWFSQWSSESANKFDLLETNCNLVSVEFHKCFVGFDEVIYVVADALKKNRTMRILSMPQNFLIEPLLVHRLSNMLTVNQTLEKVEMTLYGYQSISIIKSTLQSDKLRNIQVHINLYYEQFVCSRCATDVALDQRIRFSSELKISKVYSCVHCGQ